MARWWRTSGRTIADEESAFAASRLDFSLDEAFLSEHEVVVFRGSLRLGTRAERATIIYPPSYGEGEHPQVFAPELPLGRHWRPYDGLLCLDHLHPGDDRPMSGAEAALRAQELWRLTEEDPEELARVEVDAPFPMVDLYAFSPGVIYMLGADTGDHQEGWLRLDGSPRPLQGQITGLGAGLRGPELSLEARGRVLGGPVLMLGAWRRLDQPPPATSLAATCEWMRSRHGDLIDQAIGLAKAHRPLHKAATRTVVAFVFPDEGPRRGETQDAWLALGIDLDHGDGLLARIVSLYRQDQFVRQPGMSGLRDRHVVLVGAGALGSQIAAHLTRAGVGQLDIIDPELLEAGNVVRNELTLRDAGWPKAEALALHLQSINPFLRVRTSLLRIGSVGTMDRATEAQTQHDEWAQAVAGAQLVVNATAAPAPGRWLASLGDALRTPVLHAAVSAGAWGARVHVQRPGASGCPECLARHQDADDGVVPTWSADPNGDAVVGRGCSQPSFAAPGFELAEAAAAATRASVQVLLDGDGYPPLDFDIATLTFRDERFSRPSASYTLLSRHPECQCCAP